MRIIKREKLINGDEIRIQFNREFQVSIFKMGAIRGTIIQHSLDSLDSAEKFFKSEITRRNGLINYLKRINR